MEKLIGVLDYGPQELADSFRAVRRDTVIIAEEIGEEHYRFSPAPGSRTIAQLLVHMVVSTNRAPSEAEEQVPRSKAQIVRLLRESGEHFAQWLENLSMDFLDERVATAGGATKSRFEIILAVKEHEMHHQGQLMLIERMVGLVPHTTRGRLAAILSQKMTA